MPNTREKLIELLGADTCTENDCCDDCVYHENEEACVQYLKAKMADHLIANGVTVQEWISVTDGMPELIPCDAGTAHSEAVNVLTSGRKVLTAIWDGFDWICDAEFWDAEDEEITHWTPVLLPLPQPPKGE